MTDASGAVRARYEYDPYGRQTKVSGDLEADFGFTGFYTHQASGLNLTVTRAYNAELGRWTSRDTIEEAGGLNLYAYVDNNPINRIDPNGEFWWVAIGAVAGGGLSAYQNYAAYQSGSISGAQYAALIGVGAAGGAISTLAPGIVGGSLLGGLTSGVQSVTENAIKGENIDLAGAGENALLGTAGGILSGAVGKLGEELIYIPEQLGKVVGSKPSLVKDLGKPSGLLADLIGSLMKDKLKPGKKPPCKKKK